MRRTFAAVAGAVAAVLVGCDDETTGPAAPPPNQPPVLIRDVSAQTLWHGATRVDVDLTGAFSDPDGDPLVYAVTSSDTVIVSAVLYPGPVVALAAPMRGDAMVTVTARDRDGLEARAVFPVSVVENPDRAVLAVLYEADAIGVAPHIELNWSPDVPLGDWYGVDVNAAGRVVCFGSCWADQEGGLLETVTLLGAIPPAFGELEALEYLYLTVGLGPIPGELGALVNLKVLAFDGWLHGPIPPELGNLAALERLHLYGWHLSGPIPPGLRKLANLTFLRIGTYGRAPGGHTDVCVGSDALAAWLTGTMGWLTEWIRPCVGRADLIQVIQSDDGSVPMIADRPAVLRLFDMSPPARARFFLNGVEVHVADVSEIAFDATGGVAPPTVSDSIVPAATVPASVVQPGLEMVVEWDQGRFPPVGRRAIDVRRLPPLEITLVPLVFSDPGRDDAITRLLVHRVALTASGLNQFGFRLLPAHEVNATTHPIAGVVEVTGRRVHSAGNFLHAVRTLRQQEGGTGYWMGVVDGDYGGLAEVGGYVAWAARNSIQHELGHNLGLGHPPNAMDQLGRDCNAATRTDPNYPHPYGAIGNWGHNLLYPRPVPPNTPDLMTYCNDREWLPGPLPYPGYRVWISAYHYTKALDHRIRRGH